MIHNLDVNDLTYSRAALNLSAESRGEAQEYVVYITMNNAANCSITRIDEVIHTIIGGINAE